MDTPEPRKLRINVVLGPCHPTLPGPAGAIEKLWPGVAEHWVRDGHQVTVLARTYSGQPEVEDRNGVTILRRTGFDRSSRLGVNLLRDFTYSLRMRAALPPADITVTNAFWLPTLMSWFPHRGGSVVINVARFPKHQLWLYSRVDAFAAVSQAVAQEVARQRPTFAPRVFVVGNPVDVDLFHPPVEPPTRSQRTVAYHGRVHPEKGLHLLIEAFRRVLPQRPGLALKIIGPAEVEHGGGGPEYLRKLHAAAQGLAVEFCPPIRKPNELAQALRAADFYCYPSLADFGESFGVAPLEAMSCGLITIVSSLECFRDFTEHEVNAIVFEHRGDQAIDNLSQALLKATSDDPAIQILRQRAVERAAQFSYQAIAQQYLQRFRQVLNSNVDFRDAARSAP
jgi:glycosyltransferase involved in cell wall biosynthesis